MGQETTAIQERFIVRSTSEPGDPLPGMLWINPEGGASGNNSERYIWNDDAGSWELDSSVGPDTPDYPASGASWRDTANSQSKVYDSGAWVNVSVTDHAQLDNLSSAHDHANLSNVTANQHHSRPQDSGQNSLDVSAGATATVDTGFNHYVTIATVNSGNVNHRVEQTDNPTDVGYWTGLNSSDNVTITVYNNTGTQDRYPYCVLRY